MRILSDLPVNCQTKENQSTLILPVAGVLCRCNAAVMPERAPMRPAALDQSCHFPVIEVLAPEARRRVTPAPA